MSDSKPTRLNMTDSEDNELQRDQAWSLMVTLYPEDFSEEERREAAEYRQTQVLEDWEGLDQGLQELRNLSDQYEPKVTGPIGLDNQARANLMKVAMNIAEANRHCTESQQQSPNHHRFTVFQWLQPLSWAMVFGLALVGLWSYQSDLQTEPKSSEQFTANIEEFSFKLLLSFLTFKERGENCYL